VRHPRRHTAVVENGLSCCGCHGNDGMVRPRQMGEMRAYIDSHVADFLRNEFDEISVLYPRTFSPDLFAVDSASYRATVERLDGGGPPRGAIEYSELVAFVGQY